MKITQLEYFCATCRHHSITQAARELYVTQPAISSAIRELEKEFSINLFVRSKNHVTLTKEGELFYQKAQDMLRYIKESSSELYDLGRQTPPVRIGIPPLLSTVYFPDIYVGFSKIHPEIHLELFEYGSIRAASLVNEEALDVSLVNMDFYDIDKMNSYTIDSDSFVFCVSPEHPLAREKELTVEMIKNEPIMMYNTDSVQTNTLMGLFERHGIKPNIIMHASQLHTIRQFIAQRLGGAFLYKSVIRNLPDIVGIPMNPSIEQQIGLVWKKGIYINSSVEKFITYIQNHC